MNVLLRLRLCLKDTLRFLLAALAFSLRLLRKLALRAQTCARLRCYSAAPYGSLATVFFAQSLSPRKDSFHKSSSYFTKNLKISCNLLETSKKEDFCIYTKYPPNCLLIVFCLLMVLSKQLPYFISHIPKQKSINQDIAQKNWKHILNTKILILSKHIIKRYEKE